MKLPDLLFGVATSDHQAEAFEPEYADFRDQWEKHQGQTPRGRATDFWERYPEDIGLARNLTRQVNLLINEKKCLIFYLV